MRDQTSEGKESRGIGISVGYSFEPKGLSIAPKTLANFLERMTQLYEQGADVKRIRQYVRNWWRWVNTGVEISVMNAFPVAHRAQVLVHQFHSPSK